MKQTAYIVVLWLIIFPFKVKSQSESNLENSSFETLKELFWKHEKNVKKQLVYAKAYLNKAKNENKPIEQARGYFFYSLLSESNTALRYLDSAITCSKSVPDPKFPAYAYSAKGFIYKKQFRYKEAIDNFLIAENIAKKNNPDLYYDTKFSIAVLRSEELGEVKEALDLYKECLPYYKDKNIRSSDYSYSYQMLLFGLADAYKSLSTNDSATYYNKLGYFESKATGSSHINALFVLNEGANKIFKGNFREALDSIKKALPKIAYHKDNANILAAFYYSAKAYEGLNNKNETVKNFIKVDSMYSINNRITPEFISGYPYLISYFKKNGDKLNQLKYLTRYMQIDSVLQTNYKELTKKLQKEYDTPSLIQEKEELIQSLRKDSTKTYWGISFLVLIIIITTVFGFYQLKLKKQYYGRFEKIMQSLGEKDNISYKNEKSLEIRKSKTSTIGINDEIIDQILQKLNDFEKSKGYLDAGITIQTLADSFETNSKYISKIVNIYKEKTFIQYVNDLRIDNALRSLKEENRLRKYTIQALALEFGFNNAESFSTAFTKKTGIKPTYFIKELDGSPKKIKN